MLLPQGLASACLSTTLDDGGGLEGGDADDATQHLFNCRARMAAEPRLAWDDEALASLA